MVMKKGLVLKSTMQLRLYVINAVDVEVSVAGVSEYWGKLLDVDRKTVKMQEGFYLRHNCTIRLGVLKKKKTRR